MYDDHYGLSGRPFQLTPDPRFWFDTATHRKAMAYLGYGLAQGEGFIVITGDIGAGKTTLVGHLVDTIDHQRLNVIRIVSTAIEADDLLRTVATGLGVNPAGLAKAQLLTGIERGLQGVARTGKRTLLIVDEAQALPVSALEELRMLSNFQGVGQAMLQILLLGQPEFRDRLHGSDGLEQLRQRVIAIHHLDPMGEDEVADYIAHRLSVVGWQGRPDFAEDAFAALYRGSGGVPRRLNQLAGRVMLQAAIEDRALIDASLVEAVVADLHDDLPRANTETPAAPTPQPAAETAVDDRIEALERRLEEQDAALRRVLTLLVDWVEGETPREAYAPFARHRGLSVMLNGMSVDVEDWFQVGAFEKVIDKADWDSLAPRVEANTDAVLALFAEFGVTATFFTLGWVAHRYPALIRRIVERGHEIASHGWDHRRVFTMDAGTFRIDLKRSRDMLEQAGGVKVTGYRAPSFSIDQRTPWAHAVLADEGYAYSSSVAPVAHDHYGWRDAPRFGFRPIAGSPMIELPVTVAEFAGRRLATGGGFFRLLPAALTDFAVRQVNAKQHPAMFYFHPWEIDPGQPRVAQAPFRSKLRHYARLEAMAGKLRGLIARHEWGRVDAVVAAQTP